MNKIEEVINKVHCDDCVSFMIGLPDNCIDLVVTSPPYNFDIQYDVYKDNLPWNEYYNWCQQWLREMFRILKPDGRLCLNHYFSAGSADRRSAPLMRLNSIAEDIGYKHHGVAFWIDTTLVNKTAWGSYLSPSAPYLSSPYEGILVLYKEQWKKINKGVAQISKQEFINACHGIWNISPGKNRFKSIHPAQFPEELSGRCVRLFSWENDIVFDPFGGIGTVGLSCVKNNRNYLLTELSDEYCKIAVQRIKAETDQIKLC